MRISRITIENFRNLSLSRPEPHESEEALALVNPVPARRKSFDAWVAAVAFS